MSNASLPAELPEMVDRDLSNWHVTAEVLVRIADAAACVRPLTPYPGWRFDIDWDNPDPAFQIRQRIWSFFRGEAAETTICLKWHHGLRLNLQLGNDLSK